MQRLGQQDQEIRTNATWMFENQDHYFPWTWHCRSTETLKLQYIKYRRSLEFYAELDQIFRLDGVPESKRKYDISDKNKICRT